jgi:DNA-binding MarR family transcriptional regulator
MLLMSCCATSSDTIASRRRILFIYIFTARPHGTNGNQSRSLRKLADATGLSKSAVQSALENLRRRELIVTKAAHATAIPRHRVLRHWRVR